MKYFFTLLVFSLIACASKEKAVNDAPTLPVLPMVPVGSSATQDSLGRSPTAALDGKLLSQGDMPVPLKNIQLGLYKKQNDQWKEVAKLSTEVGGAFRFTQKLTGGTYELRVLDSKYTGSVPVTLDKDPVHDVIIYAEKK